VQYPGLQGGGALGDASMPGKPAGSMAASVRGGTYSHVAVVGGVSGGERGAASATAAAAARRRRAMPMGGAVTPPRSAPAHGGRGGRLGARAGGWNRPPRDGAPLTAPLDGVSNRRRAAATEAGAQARSPARHRGRVEPRRSRRAAQWGLDHVPGRSCLCLNTVGYKLMQASISCTDRVLFLQVLERRLLDVCTKCTESLHESCTVPYRWSVSGCTAVEHALHTARLAPFSIEKSKAAASRGSARPQRLRHSSPYPPHCPSGQSTPGIQNVKHPNSDHHPPTKAQVYQCDEVLLASFQTTEISFHSSEGRGCHPFGLSGVGL